MEKDYFLGLDMGTGSLGWAVTNNQYEILRAHGKALWGVRLFESASTAEERRIFRTSRRRLDRRNWRIQILQELFATEISAVDPGFYIRMKESKYYPEDKRDLNGKCPELPYALFVDKNFTDKDYHTQFPTIYHLRKYLMETKETPDIRLVYLAIHHMMKHRGHFLLSGDISQIKEFNGTFMQLVRNLKAEELDWGIELNEEELKFIEEILKNKEMTKTVKKTALIKQLKAKSVCEKAVLTLLSGGVVKLSDIFGEHEIDESEQPKISFSDSEYDEYIGSVEGVLGEQYYIIESAKAVYDWSVLVEIFGDSSSISEAKVKTYEKHKQDLKYLKIIVREYLSLDVYKKVFIETSDKLDNYCAYIGMTKQKGKKIDLQSKQCDRDAFYDFLKKTVVKNITDSAVKEYLEEEIEHGSFLPKQVNKENGVIPYQVHLYELKKILKNLEDRIPFIKENQEKIIQLFEFRIPYYVGPLNYTDGKDEKFTWAVRRSKDKIYPWNFEKVVDIEASAEKFIRRMTNKCTYLVGEDVLPKDSLLYRKFMVLNELNNLCLNGDHISVQLKQDIYENVFCKKRKVTIKKLKDYLKCCGYDVKSLEISGIDGDFKTQLTSYHDFKEKLTGVTLSPKDKEEIILNIVLFGEDQKLLKQRLRQLFPQLTEKQLKSISLLRYKGWGKLSKTFLEEIKSPVPGCSEEKNIISALWESEFEEDTDKYCPNLNQLLSNQYEFKKKIEDFNCKDEKVKLTYETVSNLHLSPAVKRPIWQTLKVIKEIQKVMGKAPKRVFIEMGRGNEGKKQRTLSRKSQLVNLYTACKKEVKSDEWVQEVFGRLEHEDDYQLRSKKLYLYYLQMGRCMYSQEVIPFEELWDKNKYDIDHIFPQSKTMDDSLDNLVLVKSGLNRDKSDDYPIKIEIQTARMSFWKMLKEKNFISKKKYERLVRTTKLTPDELAYFIERQLVETRQSTKAVATILKQALPSQTKVIYVKAGTVSRFRQDFDLIKVREMNDLHHAKDAYLNIVVGNSYYVKFTESASWFVRNHPRRSYNLKEMFKSDKHKVSDIVSATNGEVAWRAGKNGTIATVENIMKKNNILVTNKTYEAKGELFKAQPLKKGKGQFPLKTTDLRLANIEKYGGYNKVTGSYFVLVQSKDKKGKIKKTIEFVPIYLKELFEKNEEERIRYLTINCELMEPKILLKIKMNTLLVMNGFKMRITARQGNNIVLNNANQLILSSNEEKILKKVLKYIDRKSKNSKLKITQEDKIIESDLVLLYETFLVKIIDTVYYVKLKNSYIKLCDLKENFEKATLEDKCIAIREILHLFQCDATKPNLSVIKGSGSGRITISKTMANLDNLIMVTQSITGIFEKEIDLLAL